MATELPQEIQSILDKNGNGKLFKDSEISTINDYFNANPNSEDGFYEIQTMIPNHRSELGVFKLNNQYYGVKSFDEGSLSQIALLQHLETSELFVLKTQTFSALQIYL